MQCHYSFQIELDFFELTCFFLTPQEQPKAIRLKATCLKFTVLCLNSIPRSNKIDEFTGINCIFDPKNKAYQDKLLLIMNQLQHRQSFSVIFVKELRISFSEE